MQVEGMRLVTEHALVLVHRTPSNFELLKKVDALFNTIQNLGLQTTPIL